HGGDTVVFHTELELLPQDGVGIFYSFNSRGREDAVYGLRKAVFDQFMDRYFPATSITPESPTLATAVADAQKIAGGYESSRRVAHGFLAVFYLLQQTVITANPDGTIALPKLFGPGETRLHEVAPNRWQEIGGTRLLILHEVDGVTTVSDSDDQTSVLQRVPGRRAAPLNLTVLFASVLTLVVTVILWPVGALVRRHYRRPLALAADAHRWRTCLRIAAIVELIWLASWTMVLLPAMSLQLDVYSTGLDPVIRALQILGVIVIGFAGVGLWSLWRLCRAQTSWPSRIGNGLIAAALLGLVWIGFVGNLIGFNLNY